jgi:hypothetical protein
MEGSKMNTNAKIIVLAVGCLLSLEACVSTRTKGVSNDGASAMHGKSIAISQRAKPDFSAMTAGKAMFGLLGAAAMISAGNTIVVDNNIEDPAPFVADQLREAVENKYGMVTAAGTAPLVDTTMDGVSAKLIERWPHYRQGVGADAEEGNFANHCPHCGAMQEDYLWHSAPGDVFFGLAIGTPEAEEFTALEGRVSLNEDYGFGM